ncbi:MAG: HAD family hydrolase [Fimbriiglobus sp.]
MTWTLPPDTLGLIFDCDGTLADTMPIHFRAWQTMLTRHGIPFTEKRFYELGGMPTSRIIRLLSEETGVPVSDVDSMVHEKETHFLGFLHDVKRIDSVVNIAERYRGQLPIAVASGGYRDIVRQTLSHIGILDWFPAIVCAEDTPHHKPEPDVFLEAARRLGLPATKCVVFEDTNIGLEAAHRAGAKAVDVRGWR